MATKPEYAAYVCDQLRGAGEVAARKMFGEYGFYLDGKLVGLVCDDTVYIKPTEAGRALLGQPVLAPPYEGSKDYFRLDDIEDREAMAALLRAGWEELPLPKPKKKNTPPTA